MRVPSSWDEWIFLGPETLAVAIDPTTLRVHVLEGELAGKRFTHPTVAAAAILSTYEGILTGLPSANCIEFPGDLWRKG